MKVLQIFLVIYEALHVQAQIRKGRLSTHIQQNRYHRPHRQMEHYRRFERQRQIRPHIRVHISDNASNYLQWKTNFMNATALDESQLTKFIIPITETSSTYSSISTSFNSTSSDVKSTRSYPSFNKTSTPYNTIPPFNKTLVPNNTTISSFNITPTPNDNTISPFNKTPRLSDKISTTHDKTTTFFNKTRNPINDRYPYFSNKTTASFNESSFSFTEPLLSSTNITGTLQSDDDDDIEEDDIEEDDNNDEYFGSTHDKVKYATTISRPTIPKHTTTSKPKISFDDDCGIDNSPNFFVNTGRAKIETYPWLGVLCYRTRGKARLTTPVVLVTKQLVLASALAIHEIPKQEFRSSSRVFIGHNCSHKGLGILEYNYHPEYRKSTYSSLVVVQLNNSDVSRFWNVLRPICGPPQYILEPTFHAMILPGDCKYSRIEVHEMDYVTPEQCTSFYRRTNLDVSSIWPTRVVCSKGRSGGGCVWADGTVLALKQKGRWYLMGFGITGPGCQAPSRFVDYTDYHQWVTKAVQRIGSPAITRLDINEVVIRKTEHIQRYGRCDIEEIKHELYTDSVIIIAPASALTNIAQYNLTLSDHFDYSCVSLQATYDFPSLTKVGRPKIRVHAFCLTPNPICQQAGFQIMFFDVTIFFKWRTMFKISVYGRDRSIIDQKSLMKYANEKQAKVHLPWVQTSTSMDNSSMVQTTTQPIRTTTFRLVMG